MKQLRPVSLEVHYPCTFIYLIGVFLIKVCWK